MKTIEVVDDARVRVITFNRPDALNAFNDEMYHEAGNALEEAASSNDIACVVLTGTGRAFSAGQDLGEMAGIDTSSDGASASNAGPGFPRFIDTVAAFEKPLIAAVNGLGVGIGLTVLLHCDLVLIARGARRA